MAAIKLENAVKTFGETKVIRGVDLEVNPGEFMVFVGPSGCGKSTLLRLLSGLEELTEGDIYFDGDRVTNLSPSQRGIAMVFQSYALYPHMKVFDNMAFGMKLAGRSKEEIKKRVGQAAEMLQLTPLLDRLPRQLSGGQRQRVAIGRAIVREPRVFLFDEPLSNLDAALRVATRIEIANLHRQMEGTTMVYVTHDQVEAMTLADRICVLRDGIIEQVGTPVELYENPQTQFVAGFIGSPKMNFLTGERAAGFDAATVGVRPEHLEVASAEGSVGWSGEVIHFENVGSDVFVYLNVGESEPMAVRRSEAGDIRPGGTLAVVPQEGAKVHRFNDSGHVLNGQHHDGQHHERA